MTSITSMFAGGAGGLPPAVPIDFATLAAPPTPNACIAAPAEHAGFKHLTTAPLPVEAATAWPVLRRLHERMPRTYPHGEWPARRQAAWVVRSGLLNFPDLVAAELADGPGGARLYVFSRSVFGHSDLGVNQARVIAWIATLTAALPRG